MSAYQQLLDEFGALIGETLHQDESGCAMLESDGQVLVIARESLPNGDERMEVSFPIETANLGDALDQAEFFYTLNRLNHDAVTAHVWRIVLLEEDQLVLRANLELNEQNVHSLAQILDDGFERARGLNDLVKALLNGGPPDGAAIPEHVLRG